MDFNALESLGPAPHLNDKDRRDGYAGSALFYGFGDDDLGNADALLSGKQAWAYAMKRFKKKIWQCEYTHTDMPDYKDYIRMRPGAPPRPKGFYYAKVQLGERFQFHSVSYVRKKFNQETGFGPEGFQLLIVTHPSLQGMMAKKKIPFWALADYHMAPFGYEDFYDAPQLFFSNGVLGLGIGHVDRNSPLFGIPALRLMG